MELPLINIAKLIFILAGILGWALLLRTLWASREGIVWVFKAVLVGVAGLIAAQFLLTQMQRSPLEVDIGGYVCSGLAVALTPKRSRYIPTSVRRKVIARDLKGERYDSRKHHIDHRWPFSRGGSHTADNLRVISKKANLCKGAKKPGLRDWL
jgi:hypothetical protein